MKRTVQLLRAACIEAGVDPETVFNHYDRRDIEAYAAALADGSVRREDLHLWMASTARTIADGRCLCRACRTDTKEVAA